MKIQMKIGLVMIAFSLVLSVWVLAGGVGRADEGDGIPDPQGVYDEGAGDNYNDTDDGCRYSSDTNRLIYVSEYADENITVADNCTGIGAGAFANAPTTTVTLSGNPTIDASAFTGSRVQTVYGSGAAYNSNKEAFAGAGIQFIVNDGTALGGDDGGNTDPGAGGGEGDPGTGSGTTPDPTPSNPSSGGSDNSSDNTPAPAPAPVATADTDPAPAPASTRPATSRTPVVRTAASDLSYANVSQGGYVITSGINMTVLQSTADDVRIVCDGDFSKFVNLEMDGQIVDEANYTVTEGSTIIDLKPDYIKTLSVGVHAVRLNYTDGYAGTALVISGGATHTLDNTPKTSDGWDARLAFAAAFLMLGIAAMLWSKTNEARLKVVRKK